MDGVVGAIIEIEYRSLFFSKKVLGKVLGLVKLEGNEMEQWVIKANSEIVPRRKIFLFR